MTMQYASLQQLMDAKGDFVEYLYNETLPTHARLQLSLTPVPPVFSNWRDEQRAWRETAVLFDQSHHMPETFLSGPDARHLLNHIGVNSLENFRPGLAKQFVACNARGQIIGECVLHDLGHERYEMISGQPLHDWIQFLVETGDYDVTREFDPATWDNPTGMRVNFRYQIDGPNAGAIFDEIVEGGAPSIKFFNSARVTIAGVDVMALRHGMAGHRGYEISGPYDAGPTVRAAILAAGAEHGIVPAGADTYFSAAVESGWISYPLPAIYTGEDLRAFREWLPADSWEARFQLGGSFYSSDIEDQYVTPYDLGLTRIVNFDHDFIGREALEAVSQHPPRTKVALVWDTTDVERVFASQFAAGTPFKALRFPQNDYAQMQRDVVTAPDGTFIGLSTHSGYTVNERVLVSYGIVAMEHAVPGSEVLITWGEPHGGSRKVSVEHHVQTQVRATVHSVPFAKSVQELQRA